MRAKRHWAAHLALCIAADLVVPRADAVGRAVVAAQFLWSPSRAHRGDEEQVARRKWLETKELFQVMAPTSKGGDAPCWEPLLPQGLPTHLAHARVALSVLPGGGGASAREADRLTLPRRLVAAAAGQRAGGGVAGHRAHIGQWVQAEATHRLVRRAGAHRIVIRADVWEVARADGLQGGECEQYWS